MNDVTLRIDNLGVVATMDGSGPHGLGLMNDACIACAGGRFARANATACASCEPGAYSEPAAGACVVGACGLSGARRVRRARTTSPLPVRVWRACGLFVMGELQGRVVG